MGGGGGEANVRVKCLTFVESEGPHSTALSTVITYQHQNTYWVDFSMQVEINFPEKQKFFLIT